MSKNEFDNNTGPSKQRPQPENESQENRILRLLKSLYGNKPQSEDKVKRLVRRFLVWPPTDLQKLDSDLQKIEENKSKLNENQRNTIVNNLDNAANKLDKENPEKPNPTLDQAESGLKLAIAACVPELKTAIADTNTLKTAISESPILSPNPPAQKTSSHVQDPSLRNPTPPRVSSPSQTSTPTPTTTPANQPKNPWVIPNQPQPPGSDKKS